jgi:hypothetical protein
MAFGFDSMKSLSELSVLERRFDFSSVCAFDDDLLENLSLFMVARIVSEIRLVKRGSVENLDSSALALTAECFPLIKK